MNLVLSSYIVSKKKKNLLIYVSLKERFHGIKELSLELGLVVKPNCKWKVCQGSWL